eukprot:2516431-Amphidinium_carterae.1
MLSSTLPALKFTLYADDLNLVVTNKSDFDKACALVDDYFARIHMSIKASKTKVWTLGKGAPPAEARAF